MAPVVSSEWHPDAVVARAKELIHTSNYERVSEARQAVDDTLAHWVALTQSPQSPDPLAAAARVTELWTRYAALECELRQFKQATTVFERAVACPVAGNHPALWLQYAAFCVDRRKFSNARKVFVRALHAIAADADTRTTLWTAFHAFVVAHVEPTMTLETLKAQVPLPALEASKAPTERSSEQPQEPLVVASEPLPPVSFDSGNTLPAAVVTLSPGTNEAVVSLPLAKEKEEPTPVVVAVTSPSSRAVVVDPLLAFVDTTGEPEPRPQDDDVPSTTSHKNKTTKKRDGEDAALDADASHEKRQKPTAAEVATSTTEADDPSDDTGAGPRYFRQIPLTLPRIPACPHLLFDTAMPGELPLDVSEELLERLSNVLRDSAVFHGVTDLCASQRERDRATLYRWQDLIGMQMKEGSELFARHAAAEQASKSGTGTGAVDPLERLVRQTQHAAQRREFAARCQMSQQQFIEITGLDRANALKAQQISLENLKIPAITVTSDAQAIATQRAILSLILEAEKIWREEMAKIAAANAAAQSPPPSAKKKASPELRGSAGPSAHGSRNASGSSGAYHPPKTQQQDASYSHAGRGGFRSSRGGRSGGSDRHSHPRALAAPASGYSGSRGAPSRRDYEPLSPTSSSSYPQSTPHGAGYDDRHSVRPQQPPLHARPTGGYQGHHQQERAPSNFADRSLPHEHSSNFASPPLQHESSSHRGRFAGPSYSGDSGPASWEQPPLRQSRYGSVGVLSEGGGGGGPGGPPAGAYSNGPKPSRGRAFGAMASSPPHYGSGGGYGAFPSGPQRGNSDGGYQQHSPPYSDYQGDEDDYAAPPPSSFSSYSARNPAPYQQQQQAPPPQQHQFQQRGGRGGGGGGGGGGGYGHPHQPHSHLGQQQAPGFSRGGGGGGGFRRGGGRFGRR